MSVLKWDEDPAMNEAIDMMEHVLMLASYERHGIQMDVQVMDHAHVQEVSELFHGVSVDRGGMLVIIDYPGGLRQRIHHQPHRHKTRDSCHYLARYLLESGIVTIEEGEGLTEEPEPCYDAMSDNTQQEGSA